MQFHTLIAQALVRSLLPGVFLMWVASQNPVCAADLAITEFAASNSSGLADEDGDFSDWIEVYNPNSGPASLEGWSLTDDPSDPQKWRFPAVSVPGRGFLVVFASEKRALRATA